MTAGPTESAVRRRRLPGNTAIRAAAAALGVTLPWLLAANGHPLPRGLAQAVVGVALGVLAWLGLRWTGRALSAEMAASRWVGWGLAALMLLSIAVHFTGLSYEVGRGYYQDEGIYRAAAGRINDGALLPRNFIYGHLPYYLAAWVLWLHQLFPGPTTALATALTGLAAEAEVSWLWIRSWSALCGSLTTLAVFGIARRTMGGTSAVVEPRAHAAGFLGAGLITVATIYNEVAHVFISDVPAAFFATVCLYFVARLTGRETRRDYLWAGVAAGLAAGCKYPAGLVAVAIAAVWLWWRWRERRWSWSLPVSAAAALGTLLLVMPALLVHAGDAFTGEGRDVFFGVRQYAGSGWIGVAKDSNAAWYGARILETFGLPALVLGIAGALLLAREERARTLVMAAFPLAYTLLVSSMAMAVKRNLQPLLPVAAALLGIGAAALAARLAERWPRRFLGWRWAPWAAVALCVLAAPTVAVVRQDLALTLPGTRELVVAWMEAHLPPGAGVIKESYTPQLDPARYDLLQTRFAARVEPPELHSGRYDFVLLADSAYGRFLDPGNLRKEHQQLFAQRYRTLLALPEVQAFQPSATRLGPGFSLRRLDPPGIQYRDARHFAAADAAFLSDPAMARTNGSLEFSSPEQFALFKDYFEAGRYRVSVDGAAAAGRLRALTVENRPLGEIDVRQDAAADAELNVPARTKVFLYLQLPPGSQLRALHLRAAPAP